jgi:hypothetical protein
MRSSKLMARFALVLLVLLVVACEGYTQTGGRTVSHQTMSGGDLTVSSNKANGTAEQDIEVDVSGEVILDADVTLSVGKGSFKIELLGEEDGVTLSLEAGEGEVVNGQGWMVTDAFGEASYRVTAMEAEDVEYTIVYTFR